jgi:hypothetical protein
MVREGLLHHLVALPVILLITEHLAESISTSQLLHYIRTILWMLFHRGHNVFIITVLVCWVVHKIASWRLQLIY